MIKLIHGDTILNRFKYFTNKDQTMREFDLLYQELKNRKGCDNSAAHISWFSSYFKELNLEHPLIETSFANSIRQTLEGVNTVMTNTTISNIGKIMGKITKVDEYVTGRMNDRQLENFGYSVVFTLGFFQAKYKNEIEKRAQNFTDLSASSPGLSIGTALRIKDIEGSLLLSALDEKNGVNIGKAAMAISALYKISSPLTTKVHKAITGKELETSDVPNTTRVVDCFRLTQQCFNNSEERFSKIIGDFSEMWNIILKGYGRQDPSVLTFLDQTFKKK